MSFETVIFGIPVTLPTFDDIAKTAEKAKEAYITTVQAISLKVGLPGGRSLNTEEMATLKNTVDKNIDVAAGRNVALAEKAKVQARSELDDVQKQDEEFRRERSITKGLFDFAGGAAPIFIGVGVAVGVIALAAALRRI